MDNFGKTVEVFSKFIDLEINFWTAMLVFILLVAGFVLIAAAIFSLHIIKNSYKTKAKILGYIKRSEEKIKNGKSVIKDNFNLVYEYTNCNGDLSIEIGSDWSDTHSQNFTGCIVPVRIAPSKNYDDIYLNISNTIQTFLLLSVLLISMSALVVYTTSKSFSFFMFILLLSLLTVFGISVSMYLHYRNSESKDKKPQSKIFSLDEIKPLEHFPNPK